MRERIFCDAVRSGVKVVEKRVLRVEDIVVVGVGCCDCWVQEFRFKRRKRNE
jgi:hypothetical protein